MSRQLFQTVKERARQRCEYCLLSQAAFPLPFQIDHILAEKHGGETVESNLAFACTHCNRYKGPNIAGFDSETNQIARLFNPRTDIWEEHFRIDGPRICGKPPIGRATINVLRMNDPDQLLVRGALLQE